jgi:hypothetical protein
VWETVKTKNYRCIFISILGCHWKRKDSGGTVGGAAKNTKPQQKDLVFDEGKNLSTAEQMYDPTAIINEIRRHVDAWRALPDPKDWNVTPETARLLRHWRTHQFSGIHPFFCQIEAVETLIWLTEVAPRGDPDSYYARRELVPPDMFTCLEKAKIVITNDPAQLMYQDLADTACHRITSAITHSFIGEKSVKALLDPYNPAGSSSHISLTTSKAARANRFPQVPHQLGRPEQRLGSRVLPHRRSRKPPHRLRQKPGLGPGNPLPLRLLWPYLHPRLHHPHR